MPLLFERTKLWAESLAQQSASEDAATARERLRNTFLTFRGRVALLAAEIHRDLPDHTVHDITHLDALWEMADIIAGKDYSLTPTEAFVLGGAILLHDLGMGLASYPEGLEALRKEPLWADVITTHFRRQFNRPPTQAEVLEPPQALKREATAFLLRALHAQHAEHLALLSWKAKPTDPERFLIEDNEIRQEFGRVIGLIAHSHWWAVNRLEIEFSRTLGAPHWCPNEWIVDPLKIACLLRVSDASHIDARRAPSFLRALRRPSSYSDEHWTFQERLQKPYLADDALAYTSGHAFPLVDAPSWWLCLDTLTMIDRELRQVDALLADKGLQRLAARRVAGVDSPERLVSYIPTDRWLPVNAYLQVSDVPRLVKSLGGQELYGLNLTIPLRELIQNSADAIKARRLAENRSHDWGDIIVRLGHDGPGYWLEVEDNGIGMSSEVLTRYLLDFGTTYWGSSLMLEEFPGLLAAGIKPTGQYGIGFFSVFMIGEAVRIRTRRADAAQQETLVLEFNTGLSSRPILRPASKEERIRDGGTCARVWLTKPPEEAGGLLSTPGDSPPYTLEQLCQKVCPSLDVNVHTGQENNLTLCVSSSDWAHIDGVEFLSRLYDRNAFPSSDLEKEETLIYRMAQNLRVLINEDGEVVGRACIASSFSRKGAVTVGGLTACIARGIVGILAGKSERATRDIALPIVSRDTLSKWASEQADLIPQLYQQEDEQHDCAQIVRDCGGHTKNLPVARYQGRWVSYYDIAELTNLANELLLVEPYALRNIELLKALTLLPNVIIVEIGRQTILQSNGIFHAGYWDYHLWPDGLFGRLHTDHSFFKKGLSGVVVEAAAEAWEVSVDDVLAGSEVKKPQNRVIANMDDQEFTGDVYIVRRPR